MSVTVQNTTASLSGKTLAILEGSQTFTGQKTFNVGASAPFVVVSGAAKVDNLDADKLDGQTGSYYNDAANLTGQVPTANLQNGVDLNAVCGRLTLTTALPVTTADVTAAGTLYYALYKGNRIALYTGSAWQYFTIAQLSIAVPAAANQVYDAFIDYNAGTPALSLTAWTNDTTRATALTTQDGVLVLTGSTGKRYVGTVRTITASQLNDTAAFRHVWNYYNRVPRPLRISDATATWTYDGVLRQARATATNQVDIVIGVAEVPVSLVINEVVTNSAGTMNVGVSIGEDSTSAAATGYTGGAQVIAAAAGYVLLSGYLNKFPAVGRHIYTWLEFASAATTTWHGAALTGGGAYGLTGTIEG